MAGSSTVTCGWTSSCVHRTGCTCWTGRSSGSAIPARDVGSFIGEWLYLAVHGIPRAICDDLTHDFDRDAIHKDVLAHSVAELNRLRGQMAASVQSTSRRQRVIVSRGRPRQDATPPGRHCQPSRP